MKNILIIGYGLTGQSFRKFFSDSVIRIFIYDDNKKDISVSESFDFAKIDLALKSPGIPKNHKLLKKLTELNIRVLSDLELFYELKPNNSKLIGITGTNGKSTTTALIAEILKNNGAKAVACGNIGNPLPDLIGTKYDYYVIELSSYQLESSENYNLDYGVLLNIYQNHIEHHKTFDNYKKEKQKILQHSDRAVLSQKSSATSEIDVNAHSMLDLIKTESPKEELAFVGNQKVYWWEDTKLNVLDKDGNNTVLDGSKIKHLILGINKENIAAVFACCSYFGVRDSLIAETVLEFKGLSYRMEKIFNSYGITIINDSKSTNVISTENALKTFVSDVVLILGGSSKKGDDFAIFNNYADRIKKIYAIGRDRAMIAKKIKAISVTQYEHLGEVFVKLKLDKGDTLLFSPACASMDQFQNFEERGAKFNSYVNDNLRKIL